MAAAFDLDGWANVILPQPRSVMPSAFQTGDHMPFTTLREAIKYVMEELNDDERSNCWIITESGPLKGTPQFEELYRAIAAEDDNK